MVSRYSFRGFTGAQEPLIGRPCSPVEEAHAWASPLDYVLQADQLTPKSDRELVTVLKQLKGAAEIYLGKSVLGAVIALPFPQGTLPLPFCFPYPLLTS